MPDASEQDGVAEDHDDTAVESPGSTPDATADCTSLLLSASDSVVLPDTGGLLLRFPLDQVPDGCTVTGATLRLDPGPAAAESVVRVERVADEWTDQTVQTPMTVGDPITAAVRTGERIWSVDALVVALVEGPDRGLLLSTAGDGGPPSLTEDGNARLRSSWGPRNLPEPYSPAGPVCPLDPVAGFRVVRRGAISRRDRAATWSHPYMYPLVVFGRGGVK